MVSFNVLLVGTLAAVATASALPNVHKGRVHHVHKVRVHHGHHGRTTTTTTVNAHHRTATKATATTTTTVLSSTCTAVALSQDATFDDLTGVANNALTALPVPYDGLYYQGFEYTTIDRTTAATGIIPHSEDNYIVSNANTQTNGAPMLTINYPNSNVQSFDLQSFYFGCVNNAAPNACNIEVTGYRGQDNSVAVATQVCSQEFQFNPSTATGLQQQAFSGALNTCFTNLQFATVSFSSPGGQAANANALALVLDDVRYKTNICN